MGEVFITRKGGGGKAAAPTLVVTSVGGSFVQLDVTNNDQISQATVFLLANYDTNSATDFDILAAQSGTVINVAAATTVSTIVSGLDPDTSHTVSAQAAVIKKLPSNIVTTDTINLAGTGITAPTVGPITENLFTSTTFTVTNNDTVVSQIIKANITESTTVPTVYPFESSTLAPSTTGSITVSGLTQGTVYYIHARAFDGNFSSSNVVFGPYTQNQPIIATGGTITNYSSGGIDYKVHRFNSNGTFAVTSVPTGVTGFDSIEALIIAGGGGGGQGLGAGGGAGGLIEHSTIITAQNYGITIGGGGTGGNGGGTSASGNLQGANGANTVAFGLTAIGGGGGGTRTDSSSTPTVNNGKNGGSGGAGAAGHAGNGNIAGLRGSALQPNSASGGFGFDGGVSMDSANNWYGGGGGGAGGAGEYPTVGVNTRRGGQGGPGRLNGIMGIDYYWAGGGGGGAYNTGQGSGHGGIGGGGGGGNNGGPAGDGGGSALNSGGPGVTRAIDSVLAQTGGSGGANTGGGGGGAGWVKHVGGTGGSGIVVVRYVVGGNV